MFIIIQKESKYLISI